MKISRPDADVLVPAAGPLTPDQTRARTTHLWVGAQQDDIEIMALRPVDRLRADVAARFEKMGG